MPSEIPYITSETLAFETFPNHHMEKFFGDGLTLIWELIYSTNWLRHLTHHQLTCSERRDISYCTLTSTMRTSSTGQSLPILKQTGVPWELTFCQLFFFFLFDFMLLLINIYLKVVWSKLTLNHDAKSASPDWSPTKSTNPRSHSKTQSSSLHYGDSWFWQWSLRASPEATSRWSYCKSSQVLIRVLEAIWMSLLCMTSKCVLEPSSETASRTLNTITMDNILLKELYSLMAEFIVVQYTI